VTFDETVTTDIRESPMLVLSRKLGEKIVIGDNIILTVVKIDRNQIRIGIEAPGEIPVYREEIAPHRVSHTTLAEVGV
jgi:carbon storage regulator